MYGRGPGILRVLFILVLAVVAGGIGYSMGLANAGVATGGAAVVYAPWGFGFGFFGLLFPILLIVLLFGAIGGRRRGHGGWGYGGHGYGPGSGPRGDGGARSWGDPSGRSDVPPMFEPMLQSWHRRVHGEPPSAGTPDGTKRPEG